MSELREVQVTLDCADPAGLAGFWCEVLGYRLEPPPPGFETWDAFLESIGVPADQRNAKSAARPPEGGAGPRFFFQQVPEGKTAKNRLHLDVRAAPGLEGDARMAALEVERDRLVGLGATELWRVAPGVDHSAGHITMADPEGNEFCLD